MWFFEVSAWVGAVLSVLPKFFSAMILKLSEESVRIAAFRFNRRLGSRVDLFFKRSRF